ncbi:hypothetical protein DPMN_193427 [Dreissena polymorpha]|uniref:Uncharacterized protein n=1 Tax=Dreissena polymorpha TaxID=45954 RepID=A0A9D3XZF5_DREPO|nr:hypothetical protein DPMN_193427 [Dreissena polymorpha]
MTMGRRRDGLSTSRSYSTVFLLRTHRKSANPVLLSHKGRDQQRHQAIENWQICWT